MITYPHTYYINRWYGSGNDETAVVYRTNDVDDFISHVKEEIKKYKLDGSNSKTIVRGDKTFFSYYEASDSNNGKYAWMNMRYLSQPDSTFYDFRSYIREYGSKPVEVEKHVAVFN